ncbi:TPA: transporter [Vibrio vulnificus]|uniref:transporter n=1 Tax=Vibrio vulnificus TaxID=672 RepID=UPI001A1B9C31|nr:transporter [Vibrio vulnificus]EGQ8173862.1 transporter [Vibrio vulnificus]ELC9581715.1 transporter [Vibrio vulnificus]ELH3006264.1 transporter [Vibrio vulnificus]ELK8602331.1 transporter [Vibrio vulnificus]ELM6647963.1 transporter [Vibrio vulnificus]
MEKQGKRHVEFDYTSFLGASCSKKWTFLEALTTFAPVFGVMWKNSIAELSEPEDRLWDAALKSMSSRRSDESNLVTLLKLAKLEGIDELTVVMPYALEPTQIDFIQNRSESKIDCREQDVFVIRLKDLSDSQFD